SVAAPASSIPAGTPHPSCTPRKRQTRSTLLGSSFFIAAAGCQTGRRVSSETCFCRWIDGFGTTQGGGRAVAAEGEQRLGVARQGSWFCGDVEDAHNLAIFASTPAREG